MFESDSKFSTVYWVVLILDKDYFGLFVVSCRKRSENHNTRHCAVLTWADTLIHLIDRNNTIRTGPQNAWAAGDYMHVCFPPVGCFFVLLVIFLWFLDLLLLLG